MSQPQCSTEVSGECHASAALPQGKNHGSHLSGSWVGTGFRLDVFRVKKIPSDRDSNCDLKNAIAIVATVSSPVNTNHSHY
jgi:hypothetical protein